MQRSEIITKVAEVESFLSAKGKAIFINNTLTSTDCHLEGTFKLLHHPILPAKVLEDFNLLLHPENEKQHLSAYQKEFEGYSVLIIDDSLLNLKVMAEIFKKFKFEVNTSINPKEALKTIQEKHFDVIFIDQNMPIMNGDEAIERIRHYEKEHKQKPAIIYGLTGDTNDEIKEHILKVGANNVFTKPVHIKELYEAVSLLK